MHPLEIGGRSIGAGHGCYVIAEAGVNHNGDIALAMDLVRCAADAGCDAVKFQTYSVDDLVSPTAPMADYQARNTKSSDSQAEMLRRCHLDRRGHELLQAECRSRGITFLSTPFDPPSLALLLELNVTALKISSGDLTNSPFLAQIGASGRAVILSTGMAAPDEVDVAVSTLVQAGCPQYGLLHCVSAYPADPRDCNLRAMTGMAERFGVPIGFSDHTTGIDIALASVAAGAVILEKHITLDRSLPGPDHAASIEPNELKTLMMGIRRVDVALGDGLKVPRAEELLTAAVARKSLHLRRAVIAGQRVQADDVMALRPGTGIPPSQLASIVGRTARRDLTSGEMLSFEMLE